MRQPGEPGPGIWTSGGFNVGISYPHSRSVAPASAINEAQRPLNEIQRSVLATDEVIPLCYGECQVGGKLFAAAYNETTARWTCGYLACYGEIDQITGVWFDGELKSASTVIDYYNGTSTQVVDANLAGDITGYNDNLRLLHPTAGSFGFAYVVIQYDDADYPSFPSIVIELRGRKVWNPKTQTRVYSTNPALHLADYLTDPITGLGKTVDDTQLEALMDACDALVGGEKKRESFFVLDQPQPAERVVEILRTYAGAYVYLNNGNYELVPDQDATPVLAVTSADIVPGTVQIEQTDVSQTPTVIRAHYTDTSENLWRSRLSDPAEAAGVDAGTVEIRESTIRLDGINRHSQAYRECVERLNKLTLSDLRVSWQQYGTGVALARGDIITLSTEVGLDEKLLRIEEIQENQLGIYSITAAEHDPASYSSEVVSQATFPDGPLPDQVFPLPPTGVSAVEEKYVLKNGETASRLRVTWTAPAGAFEDFYVEAVEGANLVWTGSTTGTEIATGPLQENVTYTVNVYSRNALYISNTAGSTSQAVDGKTTSPSDPAGLTAQNKDGIVFLDWSAVAGAAYYEVRYYTTAQSWAQGTVLDARLSATTYSTDRVPVGTWRFGIRAFDSVGNNSGTQEVDLPVALASSGVTVFVQAAEPTAGESTSGDLWYESDDGNEPHYYNGSAWVSLRDATITAAQDDATDALAAAAIASQEAQAAQGTADQKIVTFYQSGTPTGAEEGDLWIDTGNDNQLKRYTSSAWTPVRDAGISTALTNASNALDDASNAQATADGKIVTYIQIDEPDNNDTPIGVAAIGVGDLWIDSNNNNLLHRYNGSNWIEVSDARIQTALDESSAALIAAQDAVNGLDGKITTYFQASEPTDPPTDLQVGDLWLQGAAASAGAYDTWLDGLSALYAIKLDGSVDDSGSAQDAPAYSGTYGAAVFPNRPAGQGIDDRWAGWNGTSLDADGGDHGVAIALYVPATIANGHYPIWSTGNTAQNQLAFISVTNNVATLRVGVVSTSDATDIDLISTPLSAGVHTLGVAWDSSGPTITVYLDKVLISAATSLAINDTAFGDPELGGSAIASAGGYTFTDIDNSGIAISDFVYTATSAEILADQGNGENIAQQMHGFLFDPTGNVTTYRYDGVGWVEFADAGISDAEAAASAAQASADLKIITWYQDADPSGAFDATNIGDIWVDTNNKNLAQRWNGSTWQSIRDETIQDAQDAADAAQADATTAINNASTALTAAQDAQTDATNAISLAQAAADGQITTFFQATEPTSGESNLGDLWLKGAAAGASVYNDWRTAQSIDYAIMLNNSVDDNGTQGDAPTYVGTYSTLVLPNRASGQGINAVWAGWTGTYLDDSVRYPAVAFTIYVPDTVANGEYAIYSDGGSNNGKGLYLKKVGSTITVKYANIDAAGDEFFTMTGNLSENTAHTLGISCENGAPDVLHFYLDGAEASTHNLVVGQFENGTVDPEVGGYGTSLADTGDTPADIDGSGIVIGDFLVGDHTWAVTNNGFAAFHNQLFGATGAVEMYRYDGSAWIIFEDSGISDAEAQALAASQKADSKIITWYSAADPTIANTFDATNDGDLWIDTDANNHLYRWDHFNTQWDSIKDGDIQAALDAANAAVVSEGAQISSNATATAGSRYPVNTSGGSTFIINLPTSPTQGDLIGFFDLNETWHLTSAFLNPGTGKSIEGGATNEDLELNVKGMSILLQWTNSKGWILV